MRDVVGVENHAGMPGEVFDVLRGMVETQTTMERALSWFFGQSPPLAPRQSMEITNTFPANL